MRPLRVLIVEDDPMIGPLLAEVLEDLGHVIVDLEVDASAAVAAARDIRPDLMIVDINLGEHSGVAAVKEVLRDGFVPHVFVTGDLFGNLELGPEAVLIQKPYRSADLVAAIARAIGGASQTVETAVVKRSGTAPYGKTPGAAFQSATTGTSG